MASFQKDSQVGLLFDLRLFLAANSRTTASGATVQLSPDQQRSLAESYMHFISVLDDLPLCIFSPGAILTPTPEWDDFQQRGLWIQKANIVITYHYLRMVILCRFMDAGYTRLLGLSEDPMSLAWRKVEIAHEAFNQVNTLPFEALRFNGEACVSCIKTSHEMDMDLRE